MNRNTEKYLVHGVILVSVVYVAIFFVAALNSNEVTLTEIQVLDVHGDTITIKTSDDGEVTEITKKQ